MPNFPITPAAAAIAASPRLPSALPVPVAEGGTASATAADARVALGAVPAGSAAPPIFPAAASDTISEVINFPFDGAQVTAIWVTPVGTDATAGTIAVTNGASGAGATMLSTNPTNLAGLGDDTPTSIALTGTVANLQGDAGDAIQISVVNSDAAHKVSVTFGLA